MYSKGRREVGSVRLGQVDRDGRLQDVAVVEGGGNLAGGGDMIHNHRITEQFLKVLAQREEIGLSSVHWDEGES